MKTVREQIDAAIREGVSLAVDGGQAYIFTADQATEAILKIIESEVIRARQDEWDYVFEFFDAAQDGARNHFRALYGDLKEERWEKLK